MTLIAEAPSAMQRLKTTILDTREALKTRQHRDGHWVFELEADVTIPAEYILLQHFLGEIDRHEQELVANYIRGTQQAGGGWPLLKLAGDDVAAPHMARARALVLSLGGAAKANVFTRFALALFEQVPWRAVPVMPLEIMLLPRWFPFHLAKVSYWSRVVIVPLLILAAVRARAENPLKIGIPELFTTPPQEEQE